MLLKKQWEDYTVAVFRTMAYSSADEMVFGRALKPVNCGFDLAIGSGFVIPELKYAPRPGTESSLESILEEYRRITTDALKRAVAIGIPMLVLELEHVYQLSHNPEWGAAVARMTAEMLEEYHSKYGLKCALRATIADFRRPANGLRDGEDLTTMLQAFDRSAAEGAHILSIESTGGKEVFNHCLTRQDLRGILFAVGVLGSLDMQFLWSKIVEIADRRGVIPGGDTDCAHANSAMFMAAGLLDTEMPHVFAALIRAIGAARSLVAFEQGAKGPDKDCGYEGPVIKAITGSPISMEGKSCACAHSSMCGNIPAAVCDLWSNEAVQYGEMFGGTTPQVFMEILGYDAAQMNAALQMGVETILRDVFVASDKYRDPQAFVLAPDVAYEIGKAIISHEDYYLRAKAAAVKAAELINQANSSGSLALTRFERRVLDECIDCLNSLPDDPDQFTSECLKEYACVEDFRPHNYGIAGGAS